MDNEMKTNLQDLYKEKEVKSKMVEEPESFSNARMEGESWEDYKSRRIQIRKFMRQNKFYESHSEDNRTIRRKRNPLRLTKPLKCIRNKWFVGRHDVTLAIKRNIPLHHYLRVVNMGLDIEKLTEMGKQIGDELREEKNGNNHNTDAE